MGTPHREQINTKQRHVQDLLAAHADLTWLDPIAGPESGFRNKAQMVVGGTTQNPTLGILDEHKHGVDLRHCGICAAGLRDAFPVIAAFITTAGLVPYDVPRRSGELKHVLLTESPGGELMLRFVLRSTESLPRIRKHLPGLLLTLPRLVVVSANLLPEHRAVLEGDDEVLLTEGSSLTMRVNEIPLHLRTRSFFQTNTEIAAALYRQAAQWTDAAAPASVWDLYCGVGGFALHVAAPGRAVLGVEFSAEAIVSAELTRDERALADVAFLAADATAFAISAAEVPDLVIVNPPRRGLGPELSIWLEHSAVTTVIYSSCNAESLAKDLALMPSLSPRIARVFDMFPQTDHYEVMVLLERVN